MSTFQLILKTIGFVIVVSLLTGAGWLVNRRVGEFLDLSRISIRDQAINGCAQVSRYVRTESSASVTTTFDEISQEPFSKCLELKNIK